MSDKPVALYRHFDKDDQLLYIGVSANTMARLSQHQQTSQWLIKAVKMTTEWFGDRQIALEAEKIAIKKEKPIHNIKHNTAMYPPVARKTLKSIRLDDGLIAEIELLAEREGRSFSNQVECLLEEALRQCPLASTPIPSKQVAPVKRFVPPTLVEVREQIILKGYTFDAETFIAHYEANGWMRGKNKIKNWKACCTTWAKREAKDNGKGKSPYQQRVEAGDARSFDIDTNF